MLKSCEGWRRCFSLAAGKPLAAGDRLQPCPSGPLHFRRAGKGRPSLQTGPWAGGGLASASPPSRPPWSSCGFECVAASNPYLPPSTHVLSAWSVCVLCPRQNSRPITSPRPCCFLLLPVSWCSQASRLSIQTWVTSLTACFLSLYRELLQPLLPRGDPSVPVGLPVCLG